MQFSNLLIYIMVVFILL